MKKLIVLLFVSSISMTFAQNDPVIMTINDKEVRKNEFLQIYLKNNDDPQFAKDSLDAYMELFVKFKLKVAEAEALGYDTIPRLMSELKGYRDQLAIPYLIDSAANKALIQEAYDRTRNEVRASHILVKVSPDASPSDTLAAWNRIDGLRKRVLNGEDFAAVAQSKNGSDDNAGANGGDLGYFSAFQTVYPFEDQAYKTNKGDVSPIFRTEFGYHIIKVADKIPARGLIETAHIMIAVKENAVNTAVEAGKQKIDEIYALLQEGASFEELAAKYSDDGSTSKKGGVLPAFGTRTRTRMFPSFEEAAFALENDGDYTEPIRTPVGFHIIKRINRSDIPTYDELIDEISKKVAKDERSKKTQDSFVTKLKKEYNYEDQTATGLKWFKENIDSSYYNGKFDFSELESNDPIFTIKGQTYTQQQFADYLAKKYRVGRQDQIDKVIDLQFQRYEKEEIIELEKSMLADKYPAYKALITEYHDGILLFEVMSDKVWNKAIKDTTGLKAYYEQHKNQYTWNERINAEYIECYNSADAKKAYKLMKKGNLDITKVASEMNEESKLSVKFKTGKFELSKYAFLNKNLKVKLNKPYEIDGKFYVVRVKEKIGAGPKELNEAKGAVTSDYQNYLEDQWLQELKEKHKVVINKEALYSIGE